MTTVKANTKKGIAIINDYEYAQRKNIRHIFKAYNKLTEKKVTSFLAIESRAKSTEGYNDDLAIASHNTYNYSTVYSYTVDGVRYIVKDTKENTYIVKVGE